MVWRCCREELRRRKLPRMQSLCDLAQPRHLRWNVSQQVRDDIETVSQALDRCRHPTSSLQSYAYCMPVHTVAVSRRCRRTQPPQSLLKKVKFSHTRYRALGPELIPVYRQSARRWREVNHAIDLAVGCHYFLPGVTPVAFTRWRYL